MDPHTTPPALAPPPRPRNDAWPRAAARLLVALGLAACAGAPARPSSPGHLPPQSAASPRQAFSAFADAAERDDYDTCWGLLAEPERVRYTPARLRDDFLAVKPLAREKLSRARAALAGVPRIDGGRAQFPIGMDRAVVLVREGDGWKVLSLE